MTGCDAVIVLQARMGSTRLPGKALRPLAGRTLLWHCLTRLVHAGVAPVVLATTTSPEDDGLEYHARQLGVHVVRGARHDVLTRFLQVMQHWPVRYLIRATGDNPAVDIEAAARTLCALGRSQADLVSEVGLPYGSGVEAVRAAALYDAAAETDDRSDREHVTLYIKRHPQRFKVVTPEAPAALWRPDLRLTVDTEADLFFMQQVLQQADAEMAPVPLARIITAADEVNRAVRVA